VWLRGFLLPRFVDGSVPSPVNSDYLYAWTYDDLLRSSDNGATWTAIPFEGDPILDPGPSGPVAAVAPSQHGVLYAGNNDGLWKSSDFGDTWIQCDPTFDQFIREVVVNPLSENIVHVGISACCVNDPSENGIWHSLDGGLTISKTITDPPSVSSTFLLRYDDSGTWLWYGNGGDMWATADLGTSWFGDNTAFPLPYGVLANDIAFDAAGNVMLAASSNAFPAPSGGGLYWQPAGVPGPWTHINFPNANVADVAVSAPGGTRFGAAGGIHEATPGSDFALAGIDEIAGLTIDAMAVDPTDPTRLIVAGLGGIQKVTMFSVDTVADTALQVYFQYSTGPVEDIAFDPNDPTKAVAAKDGGSGWGQVGLLYATAGGLSWNEPAATIGWSAREVAFDPSTPGRVLALIDGPAISESLDSGITWSAPTAPWVGGGQATCLEFDEIVPGLLYAGDEGNGLWRSEDGGTSWTQIAAGGLHSDSEVEVHPEFPGHLWVSTGAGQIYVSGDRGASWQLTVALPGGSDCTAMALDTADGSLLFGTTADSAWSMPLATPYLNLGGGSPGTGGFVPRLWAEGSLPRMTSGSPGFTIAGDRVVGFDGGNPSLPGIVVPVLGFASFPVPFIGGTWHPSILLPTVQLPAVLAVGTPGVGGTGSWSLPVPLPADPSLAGGLLVFQCVILDDGAAFDPQYVLSDAISVLLIP
jgi:hypothetical protein